MAQSYFSLSEAVALDELLDLAKPFAVTALSE